MPSAVSSPRARVEHRRAEADELLGRHRVGDRDEDPGGERRLGGHQAAPLAALGGGGSPRPALDEVRLEQLELAGLALDALLGLLGRDVPVLDDEAADPPEVDRHERGDERLERRLRVARGDDQVVDDARPEVVGEVERRDRVGHLERGGRGGRDVAADAELRPRRVAEPARLGRQFEDRRDGGRREHPAPRVGEGQRPGVELGQQPERVHLERRRLDDPLEPVGRDVVAAVDRQPVSPGSGWRSRRIVPTTWRNIGPRSAPGSLGSWILAPSRVWQTAKPPVSAEVVIQMSMPNRLMSGRPVVELEVVPDEVARHAEVAADRLADAVAVERPGQRVGDGVGDRAVVLVARVERRHEVVAALEDRPGEQLDPLGHDASAGPSRRRRAPGPRARRRSRRSSAGPRPCRRRRRSPGRSG